VLRPAIGAGEGIMDEVAVIEIGRETMFVILKLSAPLMILGTIVGVAIALVQALTTIQEMTLTFVPKIIAMLMALVLLLPFMMTSLLDFSVDLFERIAAIG
jgi:flagellar biosynthetic protein FliQ